MTTKSLVPVALAMAFATAATAQERKLPKPTRTVYRCEIGTEVRYTDEPCLAGQKVDVTPTRGLDKDTGQRRVGADVRNERTQEQVAEILKPVFGENVDQRAMRHRRARLSPAAKKECAVLDERVAVLEARERAAGGQELPAIQQSLLSDRTRHKTLGC